MGGLSDWRPGMERELIGVLHRRGVADAVTVAGECADAMQGFVNSIRDEVYEDMAERFRAFVSGEGS